MPPDGTDALRIYGVDFTCAPRRAKPITVACALLWKEKLYLEQIERLESFVAFEALLERPGPWVGGFDFPFSLPAELVRELGWPAEWPALVAHCARLERAQFRSALDAYRHTRPMGRRYAHRATDAPAGSSSPMKLVNPPVALMFHEGARRLLAAGVCVPFLSDQPSSRVALEAYPGLLVRKHLGLRASYKSDTRAAQTPARKAVRSQILDALGQARPLGVEVSLTKDLQRELSDEGSADLLDALICAVQAAWAASRPHYGLPAQARAGEGWIVSA